MRHHDDTGSVIIAQFHHLAHDLCLCCHIQCGGRFVRKQQFRLIGHTHRDSHTLAHTAGKLERIGFHHVIRAWKIHFFQHPTAFCPGIFFRDFFMGAQIFHKYISNLSCRVHHRTAVLKDHGDLTAAQVSPLFAVIGKQILSLKRNASPGNHSASCQKSKNGTDHGSLSASRFTYQ